MQYHAVLQTACLLLRWDMILGGTLQIAEKHQHNIYPRPSMRHWGSSPELNVGKYASPTNSLGKYLSLYI